MLVFAIRDIWFSLTHDYLVLQNLAASKNIDQRLLLVSILDFALMRKQAKALTNDISI